MAHTLVAVAAVLTLSACGREAPTFDPANLTIVSTPPGATIFFNGIDTGELTPYTFIGLDADLYDVSVQLQDHVSNPISIPVDLAPADNVTLDFLLSQTGLTITSNPTGATVFIDGTDTGLTTPATIAGLNQGPVEISLVLNTYLVSPASFTVNVVQDSIITVPADAFALQPQRTVILEGFGNINCIPCPQLAASLVALAEKPGFGPERFLYLEFAVNWPNLADPLYLHNPTENSDRFTDYFILGAPALFTDGVKLDDSLDAVAMEASVVADLQVDPGFRISVEADFTNPAVVGEITLLPDAAVDLTGYVLFIALYEKVIDFAERGLTPGTNGQTVFHNTFRDRIDTPPALGPLTAATPETYSFSLSRGDWPLDNLVVVAFVQHAVELTIIQAGSFGETAEAGGTP